MLVSKSSREDKKGQNMCSSVRLLQSGVSVLLSYHIHVSTASCGMNFKLLSSDGCDSIEQVDDSKTNGALPPSLVPSACFQVL